MKRTIYAIVIVFFIAVVVGSYFFNKALVVETYKSPDGKYELIIKSIFNPFSVTMPGNGGTSSHYVEVILKNANSKTIGTTNSNPKCSTILDSIEVSWDLENNEVYYAKARAINLKTGKVDC